MAECSHRARAGQGLFSNRYEKQDRDQERVCPANKHQVIDHPALNIEEIYMKLFIHEKWTRREVLVGSLLPAATGTRAQSWNVDNGTKSSIQQEIPGGSVTISGVYIDGYLHLVSLIEVVYAGTLSGRRVNVSYSIVPNFRKVNGVIEDNLYRAEDGKSITTSADRSTRVTAKGMITVNSSPEKEHAKFVGIVVPKGGEIFRGYIVATANSLATKRLSELTASGFAPLSREFKVDDPALVVIDLPSSAR